MADCTDYPTPEDAKRFKNNANSVNEFVTSDSDTFVDQDGGEHITIEGIDTLAETQRSDIQQRSDTQYSDINIRAENQRDQFDATFQAQFQYARIGNISDFVGDTLPEADKLNAYQYPDDSGNWYGAIQGQTFPITIPADPSTDNGWALVNQRPTYQGLWPGTGGSANKGDTYQTQASGTPTGQYFTALQNTTVEPVGDDVNWREVVSGNSIGLQEVTATGSTTPRRLDDRFADVINVKDFGAVGDGVADDTQAIQEAYNFSYQGDVTLSRDIYFPSGKYRITSSIFLASAIYSRFVGEGGHYTSSTIVVDFDGIGFHGVTGEPTASFMNLTFKCPDQEGYPASIGIYLETGAVENYFSNCSFRDFGSVGLKINNAFSCVIDHCLFAGNWATGLFLNGGSGNIITKPVLQDNLGTAINLQGAVNLLISPFFESNCKRNDPAGENGNFRNLYISDSNNTVLGGTLNTWPADDKWTIETAGQETSFTNFNVYDLGAAEGTLLLTGNFASANIVNSRGFASRMGGNTTNVVSTEVGSPGFFRNDILLGDHSVSGGIIKTWCNFNGTETSPIDERSGLNVTDVVRTSTGMYRVNFTTPMNSTAYSVIVSAGGNRSDVIGSYTTKNVNYVDVVVRALDGSLVDTSEVSVHLNEIIPV